MTSPHHIHSHRPATFNVGIFGSPDPKACDYPWLSHYLCCAATPIRNIAPDGCSKNFVLEQYLNNQFHTC